MLHVRARTGTRMEETMQLDRGLTPRSAAKFPRRKSVASWTTSAFRIRASNLSYNTSGVIGPGDADILVSLKPGHAPTENYVRRLREVLSREFPGNMFYFLPADIVSQTLNFGLPAPFDIQIVGRDQAKQPRDRRAACG